MQIKGLIKKVLPTESGVGKTGDKWQKQSIIIETGDKFKKNVCVQLWNDLVVKNSFKAGMEVDFEFDIESREYNEKWYTDVKIWRINSNHGGSTNGSERKNVESVSAGSQIDDDLPFNRKSGKSKYSITN